MAERGVIVDLAFAAISGENFIVQRLFMRAILGNGVPERVVIDKSGANQAGFYRLNVISKFTNAGRVIKIMQV